LKQLAEFDPSQIPKTYEVFIQVLLEATSHESLTIVAVTMQFWNKLFQTEHIPTQPWFRHLLYQILIIFNQKSTISTSPDSDQILLYEYDPLSGFESNLLTFYRVTSRVAPNFLLEFLDSKIKQALLKISENESGSLETMEKLCREIRAIISEIPESALSPENSEKTAIQFTESILKTLFEFKPADPLLIIEKLNCLTAFSNYFQIHPQNVGFMIESLMEQMLFLDNGESNIYV
jgi:hypothetical protein